MKYLPLLLILSCVADKIPWQDRIKQQAIQYCSCNGGVRYLTFNTVTLDFMCNNGSQHTVRGDIENHEIMGCLKDN